MVSALGLRKVHLMSDSSVSIAKSIGMEKVVYGVFTLAMVWAWAGADTSHFWARQILVCLISAGAIFLYVKSHGVDDFGKYFNKQSYVEGLKKSGLVSLIASAIFVVIAWLLHSVNPWNLTHLNAPPIWAALIFIFLFSPILETCSRYILQPHWGLGGVAFLDAVTFGFAAQNIYVFLFIYLSALYCGVLFSKHGLQTSIVARVIMTVGFIVGLFLFS